jgi:phosphoglycolate phosphatase-like HAD superfamily hydrolase
MHTWSDVLQSATTLVFDCDGVVLNSNRIKTEAFRLVAAPYGEAAAEALVQYHLAHGGISRYKKFEHLLTTILGRPCKQEEILTLATAYSGHVRNALLQCEVTQGLHALREKTPNCAWMMVSGSDETELRWVLKSRGLADLFDKGIFGSPASKDEIFAREARTGNLGVNAIYLGDNKYDHQAASRAKMRFIFVSDWTEFHEWQPYCSVNDIPVISRVSHLVKINGEEPKS